MDAAGRPASLPAMLRPAAAALALLMLLPASAARSRQPAAEAPLRSVAEVMRHVVNPAAELFWKNSGEVDDGEGAKTRAPKAEDAARWAAMLNAAYVLEESGRLMSLPGRARDAEQWVVFSRQLTRAGAQAVGAARAKDEAKAFEAGSALYEACYACHGKYIPRPANSLYKQQTPDDAFKPPG